MVTFIYMTEFFTPEGRGITGSICGMFECVTLAFYVILFQYITINTNWPLAYALTINLFSFFGLLYLDESPMWLLKSGKVEDA